MLFITSFTRSFRNVLNKLMHKRTASPHLETSNLMRNLYFDELSYSDNLVAQKRCLTRQKQPFSVLFFGTDDFSLESLRALHNEMKTSKLLQRLDVVTSLKARDNPVKKYALDEGLSVHDWAISLPYGEFDIGLVASFGHMIPEHIIKAFPLGMLNVHASLLPRWRGAAPVIYAILNGDRETGITIMEIKPHKFDVGCIVRQAPCIIGPHDTAPMLTKRLAKLGAELLIDCIKDLPECICSMFPQPEQGVTYAPKVTVFLSVVNWSTMDAKRVYALSRAMTGTFPLSAHWHNTSVKLFDVSLCNEDLCCKAGDFKPGAVKYHHKKQHLRIRCSDGRCITVSKIGIQGKRVMTARDFYNGFLSKRTRDERYFV